MPPPRRPVPLPVTRLPEKVLLVTVNCHMVAMVVDAAAVVAAR